MLNVTSNLSRRLFTLTVVLILWATTTVLTSPPVNAAYTTYPVGTPDSSEPSGLAPPSATALANYHQTYISDFMVNRLPRGWNVFSGIPAGDPGGQFSPHHILVAQGLLRLKVWQDPKFNNRWITGGLCQCGRQMLYGAFFVRSRVTGAGPNSAELLWPGSNVWPPEIDFNENLSHANLTTATLHWGPGNNTNFDILHINMLNWHTWGVIWTPTSVTYVVDGHAWHVNNDPATIPNIPMDLNFEQRTVCSKNFDCPTQPSALLVDWVEEYKHN
jgi:hypothetical protein